MRLTRLTAITAILTIVAAGCSDSQEQDGEAILRKITESMDYPSSGQTMFLRFECNTDWRLECEADWMIFQAKLGNGTGILEATCSPYSESAPRSTRIEITAGKLQITIPVIQSGEVIFAFSSTSVTASPTGETLDIPIRANIDDYVITTNAEWLTPDSDATDGFVRVTVAPNMTLTPRSGLVFATRTSTQDQISISVEQAFATASRATDSLALVKFYESAGGAAWNNPWPVGDDSRTIGEWNGVVTAIIDGQLRVTELRLWEQNISGPIPEEIDYLSELTMLHAGGGNNISGTLPASIVNLSKLGMLALFNNSIEGSIPAALGELPALQDLYLDGNRLTGAIPASLLLHSRWLDWSGLIKQQDGYGFTNAVEATERTALLKLHRSTNGAGWLRPWNITKDESEWSGIVLGTGDDGVRRVMEINLWDNNMSGTLPAELGTLSAVYQIHMGGNNITGPLPESMAALTKLDMLALPNNQMSGEISEKFGDIEGLTKFWINDNNFSGAVPQKLLDHPNWSGWDFARNYFTNIGNQKQ